MPLADDVDLGALARGTGGFTGAEVAALCRRGGRAAPRAPEKAERGARAQLRGACSRAPRP
jgi:SpoVK/Ycf46/Vps4 family AAA+-type ATPase